MSNWGLHKFHKWVWPWPWTFNPRQIGRYSICLPRKDWRLSWPRGWLHTEMVYLPTGSHPLQYWLGSTYSNLVDPRWLTETCYCCARLPLKSLTLVQFWLTSQANLHLVAAMFWVVTLVSAADQRFCCNDQILLLIASRSAGRPTTWFSFYGTESRSSRVVT